ncbi:MAG: hypothetical protein HWN51_06725, partial [Desulfobacterales bacterium]|nr:hypothetical protein [Desulfobacterales bacterium]
TPGDFIESCDIWYQGQVVNPEDYPITRIEDCSEIVFFVRPGKGGAFQAIFGFVLTFAGLAIPGGFGQFLTMTGIAMMLGGFSTLIFAPKAVNFEAPGNKNYGWEGVRTEYATIGTLVPICYGRVLTGGKCIGQRIYTDENNDQILDLLLVVSEGEIRGIRKQTDDGVCTSTTQDPWIKLDGNFIKTIPGASWNYRLGTLTQTVIPEFSVLSTNYADSQKLTENWYTISTAGGGNDFETVEFNFVFPYGLYITGQNGVYAYRTIIEIQYKEEPSGDWVSAGDFQWDAKKMGPFYKTVKISLPTKANYSFRMVRRGDGWAHAHDYTGEVEGWAATIQLQGYNRIIYDDLSYPGSTLVSIHAVATDRISSAQPNVEIKLDGRILKYYDGVAWQDEVWDTGAGDAGDVGRNLAWQVHDLIYSQQYGLGAYLDDALKASLKFKDLADYGNQLVDDGKGGTEKRFLSDIIIDGIVDPWDMLKELLGSCHAFPVRAGAQIWPVVEKEASPVMSFGMDNVATDDKGNTLLTETWRTLEDTPNVIEVQYFDETKDYVRETAQYPDDDTLIPAGEKIRKLTLIYHNVTRRSQATRLAKRSWLLVK